MHQKPDPLTKQLVRISAIVIILAGSIGAYGTWRYHQSGIDAKEIGDRARRESQPFLK